MAKDKEPAPVASAGDQLLGLLGRVTADDLAAVDAQLAEKRAELDALKSVRGLIADRLGVKEERKKPGPRAAAKPAATTASAAQPAATLHERQLRAARLLGTRGPLMPSVVMDECEIGPRHIGEVLNCEYFERNQKIGTVQLTAIGRRELLGTGT